MEHLRQVRLDGRDNAAADSLPQLATSQHGVVSSAQLRAYGLSRAAISRWASAGRLHRILPRVYAVGHAALSIEGRLFAGLLYAGPRAVLSHTTAAWVWSLIETEPTRIHVTVPGRRRSLPNVRIHHSRNVDPVHSPGLPVTSVVRTLLDLAGVVTFRQLRRALAEADYRGLLNADELAAVLGRGRPGSGALSRALAVHLPELAQTLSVLEERFLELCEMSGLPIPRLNAKIGRLRVDALWRDQAVAVELDGASAHGGWAAIKRDRDREMALRAKGLRVVRYSWDQVTNRPDEVAADLRRLLIERVRPSAGP
jgi:very-short-patch-repair endonuclease/predicted transcriptional regulator of viral defense system